MISYHIIHHIVLYRIVSYCIAFHYLFIYLSIYLFIIYLIHPIKPSIYSPDQPIHPLTQSTPPFIHFQSNYPFIHPYTYKSISPSIYLIYLPTIQSTHALMNLSIYPPIHVLIQVVSQPANKPAINLFISNYHVCTYVCVVCI